MKNTKKQTVSVGKPNPSGYFSGKITTASTKSGKPSLGGTGRTDFSPLAGYANPSFNTSAYAMKPNRGKAAPKKGNGIANAIAGYHGSKGKRA